LSEDLLPHLKISRNVRIAVRLPPKAADQKKQTGVPPKHARSGIGRVFSAKRLIKTAQPARFGEMSLL